MAAVGGYSLRTGSHDSLLKSRARLRSQLAVAADLGFLLLIPDLLRNGLTSLALALGFGALARRPGSSRTVLQELQSSRRRSSFGGAGRRRRGSGGSGG